MKAGKTVHIILLLMLAVYVGGTMLSHSRRIQQRASEYVSVIARNALGGSVSFTGVSMIPPCGVRIEGATLITPTADTLAYIGVLTARMKILPLIKGKVEISAIRLLNPDIRLSVDSTSGELNCRYLIDRFRSDSIERKQLDIPNIRANSLIVKNGRVSFDKPWIPRTDSVFNIAHINLSGFNTYVSIKSLSQDTAAIQIRDLTFREHSGFELDGLSGMVYAGPHSATISRMRMELPDGRLCMDHLGIGAGFTAKTLKDVPMSISINDSYINPSDFRMLLPQLCQSDDRISIVVEAAGDSRHTVINRISLESEGKEFGLKIGGIADNIPDSISLRNFTIDLNAGRTMIPWANRVLEGFGISLPQYLTKAGSISASMICNGTPSENRTTCTIRTDNAGSVAVTFTSGNGVRKASLHTVGLNLGNVTDDIGLGRADITLNATNAFRDSLSYSAGIELKVPLIEYNGYAFQGISLTGSFLPHSYSIRSGITDSNAQLAALLTYSPMDGGISMKLQADSFNLAATRFVNRDSISVISGDLDANFTSTDMDRARGMLSVNNLEYINSKGTHELHSIVFGIADLFGGNTMTTLTSPLLNVMITGRYSLSTLAESFRTVLADVFPSLNSSLHKGLGRQLRTNNTFHASIDVEKNDILPKIFDIPIVFEEPVRITADVNDRNGATSVSAAVSRLSFRDFRIADNILSVIRSGDNISLQESGSISKSDGRTYDISASLSGQNDSIGGVLSWDTGNAGDFEGNIRTEFKVGPYSPKLDALRLSADLSGSEITLNNARWTVSDSRIVSDSGRISIEGFNIAHDRQFISAGGSVDADTSSVLFVRLNDIDLKKLMNMTGSNKPGLAGNVSGEIFARSVLAEPILYGSIMADSLSALSTFFGNASVDGKWNNEAGVIEILADIENKGESAAKASGTYSPGDGVFDIGIQSRRQDLYFLNSIIPDDIFAELRGKATTLTGLRLFGTKGAIDLEGSAILDDGWFDVTPNKCKYSVPHDTLRFESGRMSFTDIHVFDERGNNATMDCIITHDRMKDFAVSLDVVTDGIELYRLPKSEVATVYGDFYIGGHPHLRTGHGRTSITGSCRTAPRTNISVNTGVNNAGNYQFLTIQDGTRKAEAENLESDREDYVTPNEPKGLMDVNVNMEITDDAVIYAKMNSITGNVFGKGNIQISYNTENGISASGIYNVSSGHCTLSLQDLLRKEFRIMESSRVMFNGNIANTTLDIHTFHNVEKSVSLKNLDASVNSSQVRVRCLMDVGGIVSSPELSFNVEMVNGSAEEKDILASALLTSEQRNMQFMYLLAIGNFYTYDYAARNADNDYSATMESLLNSTINGQINNVLSQVINSEHITLSSNISTGFLSDSQAQFVDNVFGGTLEAHLLNNRLILNGNFGYKQDALNNTSSVIGDFELKYLLLPKYGISLLGYSRNNQRYFTKTTLNTQGIGISYDTEFDRIFGNK